MDRETSSANDPCLVLVSMGSSKALGQRLKHARNSPIPFASLLGSSKAPGCAASFSSCSKALPRPRLSEESSEESIRTLKYRNTGENVSHQLFSSSCRLPSKLQLLTLQLVRLLGHLLPPQADSVWHAL